MLTVMQGDCRELLRTLPDESVHCCVTSPPYWGLRDYGVSGQLGLESTPEEYVSEMVGIFREVRRVLRSDGTCWLNLGDSYSSGGRKDYGHSLISASGFQNNSAGILRKTPEWAKPKDLIGIPWMVAFALRSDGWYLRSEIIWHKPNPMPESVADRPTKSHEQIFLLTKSSRYFYDQEAIREPLRDASLARLSQNVEAQEGSDRVPGKTNGNMKAVRFGGTKYGDDASVFSRSKSGNEWESAGGANKKTVWTVPTIGYKDAHFATFPPKLIEPCILAGTSARGCCAECGAPWERMIEYHRNGHDWNANNRAGGSRLAIGQAASDRMPTDYQRPTTLGWQPTCEHEGEPVACTVLDPFAGSGTVGKVALEFGRKAILIELNPKYCEMIQKRVEVTLGLPGLA